jgi:hypothetical protein
MVRSLKMQFIFCIICFYFSSYKSDCSGRKSGTPNCLYESFGLRIALIGHPGLKIGMWKATHMPRFTVSDEGPVS